MRALRCGWAIVGLGVLAGCGSSREEAPPRLARSYALPQVGLHFAVGQHGAIFYVPHPPRPSASEPSPEPVATNALAVVDPGGNPGQRIALAAPVVIKAVASDGSGLLYLGVWDGERDQVWVVSEEESGQGVEPRAKLPGRAGLPAGLNSLFLARVDGTLYIYALCGEKWVVQMKTDGTIVRQIELPGDGRLECGGADAEGAMYLLRGSGPIVKLTPDGATDEAWRDSEAALLDAVGALAVDPRGLVYVAASDGDTTLRAFGPDGALRFNILVEQPRQPALELAVGSAGGLYVLTGRHVWLFRP